MFVPKYLVNCNAYQPSFQFPLCFSYEDVVEKDDISRTVKEVVEEVNIFKYIDFSQNNAHGYDAIQMFEAVILAFAINGYASLRDLEKLCKYDIRFKFIMNGSTPSHMAFERFIKDKLAMPIEDIFVDINKYIEAHDVIDTEVLYIDGTKFEANANKMTFVWMKATKKFREKRWIKVMDRLSAFNKYCSKNNLNIRFSIVREINFDYLFEVVSVIEQLMAKNSIQVVHGKGKKKHELQRYQEAFKEDALKMFKYTIYSDIAGDRNSFSKTDPDATFMHMKYDYTITIIIPMYSSLDIMYRLEAVTDIYDMYMYQVTPMILEHIFHLWKAIIWRMEAIHMPHLLMPDTEVLTTINMTRNMEFNCI